MKAGGPSQHSFYDRPPFHTSPCQQTGSLGWQGCIHGWGQHGLTWWGIHSSERTYSRGTSTGGGYSGLGSIAVPWSVPEWDRGRGYLWVTVTAGPHHEAEPAESDVHHPLKSVEDSNHILDRAVNSCPGWFPHSGGYVLDIGGPLCQVGLMKIDSSESL